MKCQTRELASRCRRRQVVPQVRLEDSGVWAPTWGRVKARRRSERKEQAIMCLEVRFLSRQPSHSHRGKPFRFPAPPGGSATRKQKCGSSVPCHPLQHFDQLLLAACRLACGILGFRGEAGWTRRSRACVSPDMYFA
jgi:hypothetical protein